MKQTTQELEGPWTVGWRALPQELRAYARRLCAWADALDTRRCSKNEYRHWKAIGSQQTLREIASHLRAMCAEHPTTYAVQLALKEYLHCLQTSLSDAREEARGHNQGKGIPVTQWKAGGEAQVLSRVCCTLAKLGDAYAPAVTRHVLSADGKRLVPLLDEEDGEEQSADGLLHRCSYEKPVDHQPFPAFLRRRVSGGNPHAQAQQVSTLSLEHIRSAPNAHREGHTACPLGPFPILPDGLPLYQQNLLLGLEETLARRARVLVKTELGAMNPELMLAALDRLLQYTAIRRVLVLAGAAPLLPLLRRKFEEATSLEDGKKLNELYPVQYQLSAQLSDETRVCISSVRQVQLLTRPLNGERLGEREQAAAPSLLPSDAFEAVIIYGTPALSQVWRDVLCYLKAPYLIGFSSALPDEQLLTLFDGTVISA